MSLAASKTSIISKGEDENKRIEDRKVKLGIIKNVTVIGLAFVCLFTSYNSMSYLQSSINPDIGTNSLSVVYGGLVLSCFFVPSWMIDKLKEKKTIGFSMWGYLLYIAAQFYPQNYTLYPAAFLVGLSAAPLWSAKCTYLTHIARKYALLVGENPEVLVTRFFGIFFFFFQSTNVWGNVISSTVLSTEPTIVLQNDTTRLNQCGSNYCPGVETNDSVSLASEVTDKQRYIMSSIYLICAAMASIVIFLFLDPLERFKDEADEKNTTEKSGKELLVATAYHMQQPYQLLIIPLTMFSGIEQALFGADFTSAFVGCGLGVYMVGYVLICYGACDAISSLIWSPIVKMVGRIPVYTFGALIHASLIVVLLTWMPTPDQKVVLFLIAGLWGVADAIWQTQINSFYGVLFPKTSEAAFSNYRLWESAGFIIAYACSSALCTDAKVYIMLTFLSLGMVGYYAIEVFERTKVLPRDQSGNVVSIFQLIKM